MMNLQQSNFQRSKIYKIKMLTPKSSTKRRILEQLNQSMNQKLPLNAKMIYEKAYPQAFSLHDKFRNLQDPLGFINNEKIQKLVKNTKQTARKMKQEIEQTCEISKNMYKNMISSNEENLFTSENFRQKVSLISMNHINQNDIIKIQKKLRHRQVINDPMLILVRQLKTRQVKQKIRETRGPSFYRHQREQVLPTQYQSLNQQIKFDHIKLIGTQQFDKKCKNVEFYDILSQVEKEQPPVNAQNFNINQNWRVDRLIEKMDFVTIQTSCQWGPKSKQLFFDFENNLSYWRYGSKNPLGFQQDQKETKNKSKQQKILPNFLKFRKNRIDVNVMCDFAMRKVSQNQLKEYFKLKKQHLVRQMQNKNGQNLEERYDELKKQYDRLQQLKNKAISQRVPVKYTQTECQTIIILQQKQFDDYFNEDLNILFKKISGLNKVRQRALTDQSNKKKLIIAKNVCFQIKQNLFKLLTFVLKGEKFYPRETANKKNYSPYFDYNDLFNFENRDFVENKILTLIHDKIDQFECDMVDDIKKTELIKIYVEQRSRNNKILEIIDFNL